MPRLPALLLLAISITACASSHDDEAPSGPAVAASALCGELAAIACDAAESCCKETSSTTCVARQKATCESSLGKFVDDPRANFDEKRAGALVARWKSSAATCGKTPLLYEHVRAVFAGTGAAGASCTPDDSTFASLRTSALSCRDGNACRLYLRADGKPTGLCEARKDAACSHPLDCSAGNFCELSSSWSPGVWGECRPLRTDGWACKSDLECQSGMCGLDDRCGSSEPERACLASTYASAVKADAPSVHLRLGATNDASGTRAGDPAAADSALGTDTDSAMSCDGKDDKLTLPEGTLSGSTFTVELWMKGGKGSAGKRVFATAAKDAEGTWIGVEGTSIVATLVDDKGAAHALTSHTLDVEAWHHVVLSFDGKHGELWIDGTSHAKLDETFTARIGGAVSLCSSGTSFFPGAIDEFAFYPSVLSARRITVHRKLARAVNDWYPFGWFQ